MWEGKFIVTKRGNIARVRDIWRIQSGPDPEPCEENGGAGQREGRDTAKRAKGKKRSG